MCDVSILRPLLKNRGMFDCIDFNSPEMLCHFLNCQHLDVSGIVSGGKRSSFYGCTRRVILTEDCTELIT